MAAKSSCWPRPWILNLRYSLFRGPLRLGGFLGGAFEAVYEWDSYWQDWGMGYKWAYLVLLGGSVAIFGSLLGLERLDAEALQEVPRVVIGQLQPPVGRAPLRGQPLGSR